MNGTQNSNEVSEWLASHQLHALTPALCSGGYEDIDDLQDLACDSNNAALFARLVPAPGHRAKLRRLLHALTAVTLNASNLRVTDISPAPPAVHGDITVELEMDSPQHDPQHDPTVSPPRPRRTQQSEVHIRHPDPREEPLWYDASSPRPYGGDGGGGGGEIHSRFGESPSQHQGGYGGGGGGVDRTHSVHEAHSQMQGGYGGDNRAHSVREVPSHQGVVFGGGGGGMGRSLHEVRSQRGGAHNRIVTPLSPDGYESRAVPREVVAAPSPSFPSVPLREPNAGIFDAYNSNHNTIINATEVHSEDSDPAHRSTRRPQVSPRRNSERSRSSRSGLFSGLSSVSDFGVRGDGSSSPVPHSIVSTARHRPASAVAPAVVPSPAVVSPAVVSPAVSRHSTQQRSHSVHERGRPRALSPGTVVKPLPAASTKSVRKVAVPSASRIESVGEVRLEDQAAVNTQRRGALRKRRWAGELSAAERDRLEAGLAVAVNGDATRLQVSLKAFSFGARRVVPASALESLSVQARRRHCVLGRVDADPVSFVVSSGADLALLEKAFPIVAQAAVRYT